MYWHTPPESTAAPHVALPALDAWSRLMSRYDHPPISNIKIVRSSDGFQIRQPFTGTKTTRTLAYPSLKNRCTQYVEANTEIERVLLQEVDTSIVRAMPQPCRIEATLADQPAAHILDFAEQSPSGQTAFIDAKRDWAGYRTRRGRLQTLLGEVAALACGCRYQRIVLDRVGSRQRRDNIEIIQGYRFVPVPPHLVARAAAAVSRGPISLGRLAEILHPVIGRSMAYALMVRRIVDIDLESRLCDRSECRAVAPLAAKLPSMMP